jgi:hypothetical protein
VDLHDLTVESLKKIEEHQKTELRDSGFKEVIYHTSFGVGGNLSVCLVIDKDRVPVSRGISIMSPLDNNLKVEARVRARGRAIRAMQRKVTNAPMRARPSVKENAAFLKAYTLFGFKSMYNPAMLTSLETDLLNNLK